MISIRSSCAALKRTLRTAIVLLAELEKALSLVSIPKNNVITEKIKRKLNEILYRNDCITRRTIGISQTGYGNHPVGVVGTGHSGGLIPFWLYVILIYQFNQQVINEKTGIIGINPQL